MVVLMLQKKSKLLWEFLGKFSKRYKIFKTIVPFVKGTIFVYIRFYSPILHGKVAKLIKLGW